MRTVSVTLQSGGVIRGVLLRRYADAIVLDKAATAVQDASKQIVYVPMDGEVVIPWANIEYWQQAIDAVWLEDKLNP